MKKLLSLLILIPLLISSCEDYQQASSQKGKDPIPLGPEVEIENYVANNPRWAVNDEVKEESTKALMEKFKQLFTKGDFTLSMPFKLDGVQSYSENGQTGYLASFQFDNSKMQTDRLAHKMHMQVFGIVNSKMKDTLVQGKDYFINGKFIMYRSGFAILNSGSTLSGITEMFLPDVRMKIESIYPVGDSL